MQATSSCVSTLCACVLLEVTFSCRRLLAGLLSEPHKAWSAFMCVPELAASAQLSIHVCA